MTVWSSYSESFYLHLIDPDLDKKNYKRPDKNLFMKVIDASCSNISVVRKKPKSPQECEDYEFMIPDSLLDGENLGKKKQVLNCGISPTLLVHKTQGNSTARKINNLYISSGNIRDSTYSLAYERSQYTGINPALYADKSISRNDIYKLTQREIVNATETVYLYDSNYKDKSIPVVIKPSGVLNAGIMGLNIDTQIPEDQLEISTKERFKVYPSCFFHYLPKKTEYFMDPYTGENEEAKIECSWDGCNIKSKTYSEESKFANVNEELDILEIKADNKSIFASTIYARNFLGISVFQYYYDGEWKIKPLNNVSYQENDRVFYMSVSPYLPNEALFLKTTNEVLVYDASLCHERDQIELSTMIKKRLDVVQTVSYGMDNNQILLGGNKLYQMDKRSRKCSLLFFPIKSTITITQAKWTERKYEQAYPIRHHQILLNGRSCSFSSFWQRPRPSYWECFTAVEVHPKLNYILAAICGTNNSIYIIDLRITNAPVLDIPLSSTEFVGSRVRSMKWFCKNKDSYILLFSWKQKYPLCAKVEINTGNNATTKFLYNRLIVEDFDSDDMNYDTMIKFDRTKYFNFMNVDPEQEESDFPQPGPLVESQKDYSTFPIHLTKESAFTNIFHGYMGVTPVLFKDLDIALIMAYTTSGRLLAKELDNMKLNLKKDRSQQTMGYSDIELEDDSNRFAGFEIYTKNVMNGIPFPDNLKFDKNPDEFNVRKTNILEKQEQIKSINLSEKFINLQEQTGGDHRRYSAISVNESFASNTNYDQFNSKKILQMILTYKNETEEKDDNIISLSKFEEIYGVENTDLYPSWNPLDLRLDYEFETRLINPVVDDAEICSCSKMHGSNYEYYKDFLYKIVNLIKNFSVDKELMNNLLKDKLSPALEPDFKNELPLPAKDESEGIHHRLTDLAENHKKITIQEGALNSFGSQMILQSSIYGTRLNGEKKPVEHTEDCPAGDFVFLELSNDNEDFETLPIVDQLLSSWVLEPRDKRKVQKHSVMWRTFEAGDPVEEIREHMKKHKDLISQIMANVEGKTQ